MPTSKFRRLTIAACLMGAIGQAQASYSVVDDDPPATTAPRRGETISNQTVPFAAGSGRLGPQGRNAIQDILQSVSNNDSITITGRPDARSNAALAYQRANAIRAMLLQRGISSARIKIETDSSANIAQAGVYMSVVHVASAGAQPASRTPVNFSAVLPGPAPSAPARLTPEQAALANSDVRLLIVNKLLDINANGKIDPQTAITIMKEFTQNNVATAPQQMAPNMPPIAPAAPAIVLPQQPTPVAVAPAPVQEALAQLPAKQEKETAVAAPTPAPVPASDFSAEPETAPKPKWVLDTSKTLKDNMEDWAKKAGYRLNWKASNYIRVNTARTYENKDFLEVVRVIAASTAGLIKIEAFPDEQPTPEIRVSDR
ncbi:OmpA family protein [Aquitalea palustris]|uniref:OmpA family protein n=1 Tax=Aquitalea palustris TaxID=2480983 RepID=UPI001CF08905|nr:OmpA family protein [Aquitalea palustris]